MKILAIDPGIKTGAVLRDGDDIKFVELWDNTPLKKTKKRPGVPKHFRLFKLWKCIDSTFHFSLMDECVIVCEDAAGFIRGKAAIESSHKFRAVIELWCAINNVRLVYIQPNDLKFFALRKRSGEKSEMIEAARKHGYTGNDDNEADAYLISCWAYKYL